MEGRTKKITREITYTAAAGTGRMEVRGTAVVTGDGIAIHLFGGELPHVGAIVVSQPRPSLRPGGSPSCTSSTFNMVGHKDDELARHIAEKLARSLNMVVAVVAGVHVDAATAEEILQFSANTALLTDLLLKQITGGLEKF